MKAAAEEYVAERAEFARLLAGHFDEAELRSLCFELDVDDEELRGQTKSEKIISLIQHLERQQRVADLLQRCRRLRPEITWPDALKPAAISPLPAVSTGSDQSVHIAIAEGARTGPVIGRVENWTQIIKQPALWQDALWSFLAQHRFFWPVVIILNLVLFALYYSFKNLYLIPWWLWASTAVLLTVTAWNSYIWGWQTPVRSSSRLLATLGPGLLMAAIIGWQAWQIAFPPPLPAQALGILVAELGSGANYQPSETAARISDQLYNRLCQTIEEEFGDNCDDPAAQHVAVRRVGIIPDADTAKWYGRRLRADIVIWGQYVADAQGTTVRFQVLDTFETAVNPGYPLILPVTNSATDVIVREQDFSDDEQIKEMVALQSSVVSAFTLGLLAYVDRDFPRALNQLKTAVTVVEGNANLEIPDSGKSLIYYYLGRAYQHMGLPDQGQEWLERANSLQPYPPEPAIFASLASGYGMFGQEEERLTHLALAQAYLGDWLRTHPDDKIAIYNRGQIFQITEELSLAIASYQRVLELDPQFTVAYISLGEAEGRRGNWEAAEQWLQEALRVAAETGTKPGWAYLNLALVYRHSGRPAEAHDAYRAAIAHEPQLDTMYLEYAKFLSEQKEMDAALVLYQQLVGVSHNKGWAYEQLGHFQRQRQLLRDAAASYQQAVANQPENPLLYTYLADVSYTLGDIEEAWQAFEAAVALGTGNYYPYAQYGYRLHLAGELVRAAAMYEESLARRPADCTILQNLIQVYQTLGQSEQIIERLRQLANNRSLCPEAAQAAQEQLDTLEETQP
jgi:tetratricopeptide (TPR) repeat protein